MERGPTLPPPALSTFPAKVDEAEVPWTMSACVVVAPPYTVSPVVCPPPPIVELAVEMSPASVERPETPSVELIVCAPVSASVEPSNVRLDDDVRLPASE